MPGGEETPHIDPYKASISLQQVEGKRRDEEEKRKRLIDNKRMKKLKEKNLPRAVEIISKMNDPAQLNFRTKLLIPKAQVSDTELRNIGRMASKGAPAPDGSEATRALLGQYS